MTTITTLTTIINDITNVFRVDIIFNVSLGVSLGIPLYKYFIKAILKIIFPLNFLTFFIEDNDSIESKEFTIATTVPVNTTSRINISLKPETKLPGLYGESPVRVFIIDEKNLLDIQGLEKFPGNPFRYKIGHFNLESNILTHFPVHITPKVPLSSYKVPIWIYYAGKRINKDLNISTKK